MCSVYTPDTKNQYITKCNAWCDLPPKKQKTMQLEQTLVEISTGKQSYSHVARSTHWPSTTISFKIPTVESLPLSY